MHSILLVAQEEGIITCIIGNQPREPQTSNLALAQAQLTRGGEEGLPVAESKAERDAIVDMCASK